MNDGASQDANIRLDMLEAVCETVATAVVVYDRNDTLVFASRQFARLFPVSADILVPGTRLRDVLGALFDGGVHYGIGADRLDRPMSREEWISTRISAHWREYHEADDRIGRDRWVHFRKRRLPNGYSLSTFTDISEQRKQDEQSRIDRERTVLLEELLETLPAPLMVKDCNLVHIAANRAFRDLHGMETVAVLGRTAWDLTDAGTAARIEQSDRAVLETGRPFSAAEHIVRVDGSDLYAMIRKYRIGTPDHPVLVTCLEDASGRTAADFAEGQNCFDPVRDAGRRLLLEQVAAAVLQAAGKRVLVVTASPRVEEILVGAFRAEGADCCAVRSAREYLAFLGLAAEWRAPVDLVVLDGDLPERDRVEESHGIPVLRVAPDGDGSGFLRALVAAQAWLPAQGESAPDASFPATPDDDWYITTDDATALFAAAGDIEVLVAEDNQINQFVFSQILEGLGISHRIAENGEEAVMLWRKHRPRLVLMDIAMPVKNGFDAAREIREAEQALGIRTPIVAVTAQALNVDRQSCLAAGMDDYIAKPVSPDMIEAVYRRHVARMGQYAVA
ncbi:response regulator [Shinella daejeonensis]|uniref:response regulator n=1 Tax=Shinella daejeonensis TaxID=659017 RepID=UPI0020C7A250|nr:response regulator [Shinella daejeonensis]MCP8897502.1 response regulator [Shinella daejeonensis]